MAKKENVNVNVNATVAMSGDEFIENEYYKSSTYRAYVVTFTPENLKKLLEKCNNNNRRLTENTVDSYAKQMSNNSWIEKSGDTISFDWFGLWVDGQHRGHGAIKANKSLTTVVVVGCAPDIFYYKDTNKMRSFGDVLSIAKAGTDIGMDDKEAKEFVKFLAKSVKTTLNCINGSASEHGSATTRVSAPTNEEAIKFYTDNKEVFNNTFSMHKKFSKLEDYSLFPHKKFFDALANIAQTQGHTIEFISTYLNTLFGTNYGTSQPIKALRQYLTSSKNKTRNWNTTRVWNAIMMSWKAYVLNYDTTINDKSVEDATVEYYTVNTPTRRKTTITLAVEPAVSFKK